MGKKTSCDITIPVYNEAVDLEKSIHTLVTYLDSHFTDIDWFITIADNASTDNTLEIAKNLSKKFNKLNVVHLPQKGRGRAVKYVWTHTKTDFVAYMDVDLSSDLKHFPNLVHALQRGYDIAIGSRNAKGARVYGRNYVRTITSKCYIFLIKLFFWVNFTDAQCGFKAVTREVVNNLIPIIADNDWFFDTELLIVGEKKGFRIYDEPVTWIDNPGSTVRVLKTAEGDLKGLWRLFTTRPWNN
jgi:glycosyltransferase involved in cell wall biosynthesis